MPNTELEQVLSNWIDRAISPVGQLEDGQEPANWVAQRFIEWWKSQKVGPALSDAESAMQAIRSELESLGGWSNPQLGEALHELIHLRDALGELRTELGSSGDPSSFTE